MGEGAMTERDGATSCGCTGVCALLGVGVRSESEKGSARKIAAAIVEIEELIILRNPFQKTGGTYSVKSSVNTT
jgi:hypothetical protein